jgi:hypothetical protein
MTSLRVDDKPGLADDKLMTKLSSKVSDETDKLLWNHSLGEWSCGAEGLNADTGDRR